MYRKVTIIMRPSFHIVLGEIIEFHFSAYMVFASIGLLFVMLFIYNRLEKLELEFKEFLLMMGFMTLGVGGGSKLLFIITKIPEIFNEFSWKKCFEIVWTAGFVFYGGLIGCIFGLWLFCKLFKKQFKFTIETISPVFPLFHMFGRIGCFFGGCCYGKEATWGFSLTYEPGILRIPVQLIESLFLCMLFVVMLIMQKKQVKISYTLFYLSVYAVFRFCIEFYRGDLIRGIWFGLSTSQWVSICILFVCAMITVLSLSKTQIEVK